MFDPHHCWWVPVPFLRRPCHWIVSRHFFEKRLQVVFFWGLAVLRRPRGKTKIEESRVVYLTIGKQREKIGSFWVMLLHAASRSSIAPHFPGGSAQWYTGIKHGLLEIPLQLLTFVNKVVGCV